MITLKLAHLYSKYLNLYGDRGNILALSNRCKWRGIELQVDDVDIDSRNKLSDYNLIFVGGGQDSGQLKVAADFQKRKNELSEVVEAGMPALAVCGGYQLLGRSYETSTGEIMPGIEILDIDTHAEEKRLIGNISAELLIDFRQEPKPNKKTLVGFENHAGRTVITNDLRTQPLAKVIHGFGNDGKALYEGAVYKNVFGTYLHGSLLPKNPHLADEIIWRALQFSKQDIDWLKPLEDELEFKAHDFALKLK